MLSLSNKKDFMMKNNNQNSIRLKKRVRDYLSQLLLRIC